jgi:hypothetical protein
MPDLGLEILSSEHRQRPLLEALTVAYDSTVTAFRPGRSPSTLSLGGPRPCGASVAPTGEAATTETAVRPPTEGDVSAIEVRVRIDA